MEEETAILSQTAPKSNPPGDTSPPVAAGAKHLIKNSVILSLSKDL
jgi:hypothetical protein